MGGYTHQEFEQVRCNLCGADTTRKVMNINGFTIVRCTDCNLKYVNPRLKETKLHEIYTDSYYTNPAFKGKDVTFFGYEKYLEDKKYIRLTFKKRLAVINRLVPHKGKLLDIGCAYGIFLELAQEHGWNVTGIEIARHPYHYVKEQLKIPVYNQPLELIKFPSDSFDAISIFDVIEHLPNPKSTMAEINRILRPGGVLAITTPNIGSFSAKILGKNWEEVKRIREHIYFFSHDTLGKMLHGLDFKVLKKETAGRYFPLQSALNRGKVYNKPIFSALEKICRVFGLNEKIIYIDPRYKMTLYAKKISKQKSKQKSTHES